MQQAQSESLKIQCRSKPKLRTFNLMNNFEKSPDYISKPLSFVQRRVIAKVRTGCLPLRLETARYERPRIPAEERYCHACHAREYSNKEPVNEHEFVETEFHFIFLCKLYENLRENWMSRIQTPDNFDLLPVGEKISVIFNAQNVKSTAQFLIHSFDLRSKTIHN